MSAEIKNKIESEIENSQNNCERQYETHIIPTTNKVFYEKLLNSIKKGDRLELFLSQDESLISLIDDSAHVGDSESIKFLVSLGVLDNRKVSKIYGEHYLNPSDYDFCIKTTALSSCLNKHYLEEMTSQIKEEYLKKSGDKDFKHFWDEEAAVLNLINTQIELRARKIYKTHRPDVLRNLLVENLSDKDYNKELLALLAKKDTAGATQFTIQYRDRELQREENIIKIFKENIKNRLFCLFLNQQNLKVLTDVLGKDKNLVCSNKHYDKMNSQK